MSAVRKIAVTDPDGSPAFTLETYGLPERPVIMHECDHCQASRIVSLTDARELAAWLIGEAVDDAQGSGVIPSIVRPCQRCGVPVGETEGSWFDRNGGGFCEAGGEHQ